MSWANEDLREGILVLFAEAQRHGFSRIARDVARFEAWQLEVNERRKRRALEAYRTSERRKAQVRAAQKTPLAKLRAHARYLERKKSGLIHQRIYSEMSEEAKVKERARVARYRALKKAGKS